MYSDFFHEASRFWLRSGSYLVYEVKINNARRVVCVCVCETFSPSGGERQTGIARSRGELLWVSVCLGVV